MEGLRDQLAGTRRETTLWTDTGQCWRAVRLPLCPDDYAEHPAGRVGRLPFQRLTPRAGSLHLYAYFLDFSCGYLYAYEKMGAVWQCEIGGEKVLINCIDVV